MNTNQTIELMKTLPCLSIRQPWCWYIVRPDLTDLEKREAARVRGELKDHENRVWWAGSPLRKFRGRFLIHASSGMTRAEYEDALLFVADFYFRGGPAIDPEPTFEGLERGGIVGVGEVVDFVTTSRSSWFTGPGALVLRNVEPLPFVACKGALGFFRAGVAA